jgi:hypothetical protein
MSASSQPLDERSGNFELLDHRQFSSETLADDALLDFTIVSWRRYSAQMVKHVDRNNNANCVTKDP